MIKVIAFDLGGVLFAEGKSVLMKKLSKEYGYDRGIVLEILKSPKSIDLRKGLITDEEFWEWAQENLPPEYDTLLIKKEWYDSYILDKDIFDLIKKLRGRYKLIAFSGNIKSRVEYLDRKYDFRKYFDVEVYSYDYHLTKQEKGFVEIMIKKSGVLPEEIAYVDDNEKYLDAAKECSINVLVYSRGQLKRLFRRLKDLGVNYST